MAIEQPKKTSEQPNLHEILKGIEGRKGFLDYHDIETEIRQVWQKFSTERPPFEWLSEIIAFQFMEEYRGNIEGYGDYFGPMMEATSADGTPIRAPDAKLVTAEMIAYWAERAKSSQHPVMAARYAGLVFDLSKIVTGKAASFEIAEIYFNNLLKISEDRLQEHEKDIVHKLERAIHVAISLKNEGWLAKARQETLACQNRINRDDAPGYWAIAHRLLIENKKSQITGEEEKQIINGLENRLSSLELKIVDGQMADPWNYETAAEPLANYYKRKNSKTDLERIVTIWGNAFEKAIETVSGMLASSWLQHIHEIYIRYGFKDKAEWVAKKLHDVGESVIEELKPHSVEVQIPKEEIEKFVAAFTNADIERALARLAIHFIPDKKETLEMVHKLAKENPFSYLVTRQIMDSDGRVVAIVNSPDVDPEGHIIQQITMEMGLRSVFFDDVAAGIDKKFGWNKENLLNFIYKSPCFQDERKGIIEKGISAYIEGDYLVSAHLLIPQIEEAVRTILEMFGGAVLEKNRQSEGFKYKTLDKLLREEAIQHVLGDNLSFYLRVILTDPRGLNLRNDVCHGLIKDNGIHRIHINRIIHVLLCLGLLRPKEKRDGE